MKEILLSEAHFYSVLLLEQHQPIPISCCTTHLPGCREDSSTWADLGTHVSLFMPSFPPEASWVAEMKPFAVRQSKGVCETHP